MARFEFLVTDSLDDEVNKYKTHKAYTASVSPHVCHAYMLVRYLILWKRVLQFKEEKVTRIRMLRVTM